MLDWLSSLYEYRNIKEIADLIHDVEKLRSLYHNQRYDEISMHISVLTLKYQKEAIAWNAVNHNMPTNADESFRNAEAFLKNVAAEKMMDCVG